jgi:hypothetical protein
LLYFAGGLPIKLSLDLIVSEAPGFKNYRIER